MERKIHEIHELLERDESLMDKHSLLSGYPGLSLYYATAYQVYQDEQFLTKARDILNLSLDFAVDNPHIYTYCYGLSGVLWLTEYFISNEIIESDLRKELKECDGFLFKYAIKELNNGNYDFLHGALGMMYYLTNRPDSRRNYNFLCQLFEGLKKRATAFGNRTAWPAFNLTERRPTPGQCDLGLSHGIASIIIFLCFFYEKGVERQQCKDLIGQAIDLILEYEDAGEGQTGNEDGLFPYRIGQGSHPEKARLAWCYGDLGIAIAIWKAGKSLDNAFYRAKAIQILEFNCGRRDKKKNLVMDAGLCHGSSGIAQIFYHFFKETGISIFGQTSQWWINETLNFAQYPDGLAGYKFFHRQHGWINQHGLLEGVMGVGLTLLTNYTEKQLRWDESMLVL